MAAICMIDDPLPEKLSGRLLVWCGCWVGHWGNARLWIWCEFNSEKAAKGALI